MIVGIVASFDSVHGVGKVSLLDGTEASFRYVDGQGLQMTMGELLPALTGRHHQRGLGVLKRPRRGDALLLDFDGKDVRRWAYLEHLLFVLERQFGSDFSRSSERDMTPAA